jgi:hypothetical protein
MALPAPNLDDRRFQNLVDDAKRLVQRRCPEWTDHNVSDPGVTLIETFAYMTDQLLCVHHDRVARHRAVRDVVHRIDRGRRDLAKSHRRASAVIVLLLLAAAGS